MKGTAHSHKELQIAVVFGWEGKKKKGINRPGELQFDIKNNMMDSPQWPLALVAGGQGEKKKASKKRKKKS